MERNSYLPQGISLLSNPDLIKMAIAYRQAHGFLASTPSVRLCGVRAQLETALLALEQELRIRRLQFHLGDFNEMEPAEEAAA